jgi:hypothetical protein
MSRNPVINNKMDNSNMLNHTGTSSPILLTHTSIPSTQFFTHFHIPFPFLKHSHILKQSFWPNKVQSKQSRLAILPVFAVKQCAIYKTGIGLCL